MIHGLCAIHRRERMYQLYASNWCGGLVVVEHPSTVGAVPDRL